MLTTSWYSTQRSAYANIWLDNTPDAEPIVYEIDHRFFLVPRLWTVKLYDWDRASAPSYFDVPANTELSSEFCASFGQCPFYNPKFDLSAVVSSLWLKYDIPLFIELWLRSIGSVEFLNGDNYHHVTRDGVQLTQALKRPNETPVLLDDSQLSPILVCLEKLVQLTKVKLHVELEIQSYHHEHQHQELFRLPPIKGWIKRAQTFLSLILNVDKVKYTDRLDLFLKNLAMEVKIETQRQQRTSAFPLDINNRTQIRQYVKDSSTAGHNDLLEVVIGSINLHTTRYLDDILSLLESL
eukprot:GILJ01027149.1.p1 GENE.GILJ01027149.1~~GILJ01027149.1.p1  ORF type:complete len:295 (+),score=24.64 GILJ01027149.1:46-930(+)